MKIEDKVDEEKPTVYITKSQMEDIREALYKSLLDEDESTLIRDRNAKNVENLREELDDLSDATIISDEEMYLRRNGIHSIYLTAYTGIEIHNPYSQDTHLYGNDGLHRIVWLHTYLDCSPKRWNNYSPNLTTEQKVTLIELGIYPENTTIEKQETYASLVELLNAVEIDLGLEMSLLPYIDERFFDEKIDGRKRHVLIGEGCQGIVVQFQGFTFKLSTDAKREIEILKKINDDIQCKYVVNIGGTITEETIVLNEGVILLEYIKGDSLGQIVDNDGILPSEKVLKYGADICNGLLEMRESGYYHTDLHINNVMIDQENDRAVIIDLGSATDDPLKINPLNRAYGTNDLIALGLIMYKAATGTNLFNISEEETLLSRVKWETKSERERTYENLTLKSEMLRKVREKINNKSLAEVIVNLLNQELNKQPSYSEVEEAFFGNK